MATETKLRQLAQGGCPVYYFYSSERYLVRQAVARAAKLLAEGEDEETTVLDGAAPEIEQLIMAAGTISFFGTRRVVLLPEVDPAAYSDKDLDELCATLASLENAVVVLGSVFEMERNKLKLGKRAQKLIAQCTKVGFAEELAKPKPYELKVMMMDRAKAQDTTLSEGTATALLERCGEDPFLLENEVDKLCALSGYQTVTTAMVAEMGTVSLEADVFEMIRMITAKNDHRRLQKAANASPPAAGAHPHHGGHDRQLCGSLSGQTGRSQAEELQHRVQGFRLQGQRLPAQALCRDSQPLHAAPAGSLYADLA